MKLYVIDTNIIFSAIRSPSSDIGQFFQSANSKTIELIAPSQILVELSRHNSKLVSLTGLNAEGVLDRQQHMLRNVEIVQNSDIPVVAYMRAAPLVRDVDQDDITFVALNEDRTGWLITGDRELTKGLVSKGYKRLLTFRQFLDQL